jgi:hypothetical protein
MLEAGQEGVLMKTVPRFFLVAIILASIPLGPSLSSAAGRSGRIPAHIASRFGPTSDPAWVSAASVVDRQGNLIWDSLPFGVRTGAEIQMKDGSYKPGGCLNFGPLSYDNAGAVQPRGSLKDLVQNSLGIIRGTVTGIDQGFGVGNPSLLLEVRVEEWLKRSKKIADSDFLYLPYPVAEFEVGGYRFCKTDPRWPEPPRIGDTVLLFPYRTPYDPADQVIVPDPDGFEVIIERGEGLALPRQLKSLSDFRGIQSIDVIRERVLTHLRDIKPSRPSEF